jgi:hypothetical protein
MKPGSGNMNVDPREYYSDPAKLGGLMIHEDVGAFLYDALGEPDFDLSGQYPTQAFSNLSELATSQLTGMGSRYLKEPPHDRDPNNAVFGSKEYHQAYQFYKDCYNKKVCGKTMWISLTHSTYHTHVYVVLFNPLFMWHRRTVTCWWKLDCSSCCKISGEMECAVAEKDANAVDPVKRAAPPSWWKPGQGKK